MSAWTRNESPRMLRALDCLFSQIGGERPPAPSECGEPAAAPPAHVQPPPRVETQADLQAAYEWLVREKQRLDGYTNAQLQRVRHEHEAMLHRYYLNEQSLILRSQELTSKEEFLTRQTRGLQEQARQLAEREQALAAQREQLCQAHAELEALQEASADARRDAFLQHGLRDTLRAETAALQRDRQKARDDLEEMERRLQQQREAREKEEALLAARQAQLEQRLAALDRSEEAVQQRLAELDDMEARLQQEIEDQERRLAHERRAVEAQAALLRQRAKAEESRRPHEPLKKGPAAAPIRRPHAAS